MLIDTHCHLDFPDFDRDREEVIARCREQGISHIINIGSSLRGSKDSLALANNCDFVYATVGLHPHEADSFNEKIPVVLSQLAREDKAVAIGEIGLDYFKNYSKQDNQKILFKSMLKLAKAAGLPVVIHNREAQEDMLKIIKSFMPLKAVVHCFSGDQDFLRECLGLGFFISFTCNITYKKAEKLRALVKTAPLERLFLETDAPFLPPEGLRGARNEPVYVKNLAEEISRIKGLSFEEVASITTENAKEFFDLK
ncbi:TatD family hydrolase [Candidatus Omnitrophota bacterium]